MSPQILHLFVYCYSHHRDLHSFPTRRSSDLPSESWLAIRGCCGASTAVLDRVEDRGPRRVDRASSSGSRGSMRAWPSSRSEEHTSELQSQSNLVCRLLLEKKKNR